MRTARILAAPTALLAAPLTALLAAGCAGPAPTPSAVAAHSPVFYAVDGAEPAEPLVAVSQLTGRVTRRLAPGSRDHFGLMGVVSAGSGSLDLTYGREPDCTSDVAGCGPKAATCGGEVDQLDLGTGRLRTLVSEPDTVLLRAATPSPDGTELALQVAPCVPSYFNDHLVILRLTDRRTVVIGAGLPRCHVLGTPVWADADHVTVTYAAAPGTAPYTGPDGTCSGPGARSLVTVDARVAQLGVKGTVVKPDRGCTVDDVAVDGPAVWTLQSCGKEPDAVDGPLLLRETGPVTATFTIGRCADGESLAARSGTVVVAAYEFCNPPGTTDPRTDVVALKPGGRPGVLTSVSGGTVAYGSVAL